MRQMFMVLALILGTLTACGNRSDNPGTTAANPEIPAPQPKPSPAPAGVVEGFTPLKVQAEVAPPIESFANSLVIEVKENSVGRMSFDFAPDHNGHLRFDTGRNLRILGQECTQSGGRSYFFDLTWSLINADGTLTELTGYTPFTNRYPFHAGSRYRLTYQVRDLGAAFSDCRSVQMRFAIQESAR